MKKRLMNRTVALLLACLMLFSAVDVPITAAETEIKISSVKEFIDFAQKCSLDTWSQGKTVRLTADIDLSGTDFSSVPTFGGTFFGDGHTIKGLKLKGKGSRQGLFRSVQPNSTISDLKVEGKVKFSGTCTDIGGIVGSNSGTIQNCEFRGSVKGNTNVGGIAGINLENGQINGCSASGTIQGESGTGGVAGKNLGILMKCKNVASVNIAETETLPDTDTTETLRQLAGTKTTESLLDGNTDTGGVVGYSSGAVQSCTNTGNVGYPHIGYNVGGIVGRQTGYLSGCVNSGNVLGRKDIGGIAGQAEPYIAMTPGGDKLDSLRQELDTLDSLIAQAMDHVDAAGDDISVRLANMGKITNDAQDSSKRLADSGVDFVDKNMEALTSVSVTLVNGLDKTAPALNELENAAKELSLMIENFDKGLKDLEVSPENKEALDAANKNLRAAYEEVNNASANLKTAFNNLTNALVRNDNAGVNAALAEVAAALIKLGDSYANAGNSFGDTAGALKPIKIDKEVIENLQNLLHQIAEALKQAGAAFPKALEDLEKVKNAFTDVSTALGNGVNAAKNLGSAADSLFTILSKSTDSEGAKKNFSEAVEHSGALSHSIEKAFGIFADGMRALSNDGPIEFASFGEETRNAGEDLYASLGRLSSEMQGLNTSINGNSDVLTADIRAISHQFNVVFDVLLDSLSNLSNGGGKDMEDYIVDTSDEDITATHLGKVADCRSTGTVEGDRNVGGILGAMAIEYDLDPEDDIEHFSAANTYELKVVLENCVNNGTVTGKKDCVGGLVGRMDLGTAIDGQNYGAVESSDGNYVGGAIGWSEGSIRRCYAKCTLSGGDYVGGLAGEAKKLTDSFAIVTVSDGGEFVGAIAGNADLENGVIKNNSFVDTGVAAIDGVSYTDKAAPVAFEDVKKKEGVPSEFASFTLTLSADGETVAKIPFLYGSDLSLIELPEVPPHEDEYGKWPEFDTSGLKSDITLEAVYAPWVTLVDSEEKDDKLSIALAEGSFTEETTLHVTENKDVSPVKENGIVWNVELDEAKLTENNEVSLRLLNKVGRKAEVWQLVGEEWKQAESTRSGQYLLLTMAGTTGTFCICEKNNDTMTFVWILALAAVLLIIVFFFIRSRSRKKHKKANDK